MVFSTRVPRIDSCTKGCPSLSRPSADSSAMRGPVPVVCVGARSRASASFGSPAETVDARKQGRLRATAEHYRQNIPRASKKACRFDIVAITGDGEREDLRWLRDVF